MELQHARDQNLEGRWRGSDAAVAESRWVEHPAVARRNHFHFPQSVWQKNKKLERTTRMVSLAWCGVRGLAKSSDVTTTPRHSLQQESACTEMSLCAGMFGKLRHVAWPLTLLRRVAAPFAPERSWRSSSKHRAKDRPTGSMPRRLPLVSNVYERFLECSHCPECCHAEPQIA